MGIKICKIFTSDTDMAVVNIPIPIPPLRRVGAVFKALSATYFITKFAKIALTGEPIGQPNICL